MQFDKTKNQKYLSRIQNPIEIKILILQHNVLIYVIEL